ncbi:MAG: hypothetical protein R2761_22745 [Acidimicrobiales bacterium]
MVSSVPIEISLDAVIVAVTDDAPRLLTIDGPAGMPALPSGPFQPQDRTLEMALRRWVLDQTGLDVGYVEQLYTFGDRERGPAGSGSDGAGSDDEVRQLSIAYLALVREGSPSAGASWRDVYDFFPWEDHRDGRPAMIDEVILPTLQRFIDAGADVAAGSESRSRAERVRMAFGGPRLPFDGVRALERYELLYEVGLLFESENRRRRTGGAPAPVLASRSMYLDHRRIAATALGRLRGKLTYRPVVFELLPARFTLLQLQQVVEALAGIRLHKGNFRRLVEGAGLVEGTGELARTGGRPAELFRFRREVLGERPRPGVGTPWVRS